MLTFVIVFFLCTGFRSSSDYIPASSLEKVGSVYLSNFPICGETAPGYRGSPRTSQWRHEFPDHIERKLHGIRAVVSWDGQFTCGHVIMLQEIDSGIFIPMKFTERTRVLW